LEKLLLITVLQKLNELVGKKKEQKSDFYSVLLLIQNC